MNKPAQIPTSQRATEGNPDAYPTPVPTRQIEPDEHIKDFEWLQQFLDGLKKSRWGAL